MRRQRTEVVVDASLATFRIEDDSARMDRAVELLAQIIVADLMSKEKEKRHD